MTRTRVLALAAVSMIFGSFASRSVFAKEVAAIPIALKPGITMTVDQIMARERLQPAGLSPATTVRDVDLDAGLTTSVGSPDLPQTVGISFKATDFAAALYIPPQPAGDVGPTQVLIHVNGRVKVFDKNGNVGSLNVSMASFWAPVTATPVENPQVRFDRLSGRWYVFAVTTESVDNSLVIAVTSGPTITSGSSFTFFSIPFTVANWFGDFWGDLSVGIDANAVYIGCNQYIDRAFPPPWAAAFVVRKSSLTGGGPIIVTSFPGIATNLEGGPFAPRGVDNDDPTWTEGYFIGTEHFLGHLSLIRVTDPGGSPSLSPPIPLAVSDTDLLSQSALQSSVNLDAGVRRLYAASIHKNKLTGVTSLWTAHSVETDMSCAPSRTGNARRLGVAWYEIGDLTAAPTIAQSGTLCTTAFGNGVTNTERGFLYPTVAATGQGHMALASTCASTTEYAGIAAAGRLRTDPAAGTRAPETVVLAGVTSYVRVDPSGRNLWGDYSFTDVDPNDDQTVWTIQQYADTPVSNWAIRAVQLKAPPPPNLQNASNTLCVGAAAIPVTINGSDSCAAPTCTNGLCTAGGVCPEFFDPGPDTGGPGYAKHITASVTGGVTVNSASIVLPEDPANQRVLSVALSLNTTATTAGTRVITITNPDGQFKSAGLITVMANRVPASNAGGPYAICAAAPVVLNGTASTDPDTACGDSLASYAWDLNNDGTFDVTGATPTVAPSQLAALGLVLGDYTIKLRVTDTHGATSTSSGALTVLAQGAGCTDGDACTQVDTCQSGVCVGSTPVTCGASDQCHGVGTCIPTTGSCSNPELPDGTSCNDADATTCGDACTSATCAGHGVPLPIELDASVRLAKSPSDTSISWTDAPGPYAVYRGSSTAPWTYNHSCFAPGVVTTETHDSSVPAPGVLFYYLVTRFDECRESMPGRDGHLNPIPNAMPCSPP